MILVGITGGIGCGKSTVARFLKEMGCRVLDADRIAADVLKKRAVRKRLKDIFGPGIFSGDMIDRKRLAEAAFGNVALVRKLNAATHPLIIKAIEDGIKLGGKAGIIAVDAPLLIESGLHKKMDRIIVVTSGKSKSLGRALKRGFSREDIKRRSCSQLPTKEKEKYADMVINNDGTKRETRKQVEKMIKELIRGKNG